MIQTWYAAPMCMTFPPGWEPAWVRELASLEGGMDAEEHGGANHWSVAAGRGGIGAGPDGGGYITAGEPTQGAMTDDDNLRRPDVRAPTMRQARSRQQSARADVRFRDGQKPSLVATPDRKRPMPTRLSHRNTFDLRQSGMRFGRIAHQSLQQVEPGSTCLWPSSHRHWRRASAGEQVARIVPTESNTKPQ